jgi:hypothetical protein
VRGSRADAAFVAATAAILRSLADVVREWGQAQELDAYRPGLAEAVEEWTAKLGALADDLENGGTVATLDLLHDLAIVHGYFGNELRAAVRAAARGSE